MKKLVLEMKIKKELKRFQEFKSSFKFEMKELKETDDGSIFLNDVCLKDGKTGEWFSEPENIINIAYMFHGVLPKALSNLFRYKFYFKGFIFESAEAVFQCLKVKDKKLQRKLFDYSGIPSNKLSAFSDYNWKEKGYVYFQGKEIKRDSKEYDDFIDEMYVSLLQNPLYRNALKNSGDKILLHSIGVNDKTKTLFTRFEFERQVNALRAYVNEYYK